MAQPDPLPANTAGTFIGSMRVGVHLAPTKTNNALFWGMK